MQDLRTTSTMALQAGVPTVLQLYHWHILRAVSDLLRSCNCEGN
jgi:hypothetical protein